jgi:glutathione S-transferase
MKLHMSPISTTSRPVKLFCAEAGVDETMVPVDLMAGEHHGEKFVALNPNRLVPVLEDGDFVLTESSAILKYLADKVGSPLYPKDLEQRARVNERMDWFNTQLYRELGYHLVYPQLFPHHKRASDEVTNGTVA